jgi:hypothetical protein
MTNKKLFVFDLDNTLAPSKGDLPPESVKLVERIVTSGKFFAILSSAGLYQIQEKVIPHLNYLPQENIVYGATLGTKIHYKTAEKWVTENHNAFTKQERKEIKVYIDQLARNHPLTSRETIGRYFDDRETLLTYSVLGVDAPREQKAAWDPDYEKRKVLKKLIEQKFPHLSVVYGGKSSLDITEKGVDKKSGLQNILNHFSLTAKDTLYTGDEFTELGNDYPLLSIPELETLEVLNYQETVEKMTQTLDL